jgi:hypothetical protein
MTVVATLGAPGVYRDRQEPDRQFRAVPLDTAAFVGIAQRGPAWGVLRDELGRRDDGGSGGSARLVRSVPRLVHSWDEYRWLYGGYEGDWLLARSVAAFFRQGGRRAWIVRVVASGQPAGMGRAVHVLPGLRSGTSDSVRLSAKNEGEWGNHLAISVDVSLRRLNWLVAPTGHTEDHTVAVEPIPGRADPPPEVGALLEIPGVGQAFVAGLRTAGTTAVLTLEHLPGAAGGLALSELAGKQLGELTATVTITDLDPTIERKETFERLGFHPDHARFLPRHLDDFSELVGADDDTFTHPIRPEPGRWSFTSSLDIVGVDRNDLIEPDDFVDPDWQFTGDYPDDGVFSLIHVGERAKSAAGIQPFERDARIAMLCAPDLQRPQAAFTAQPERIGSAAGSRFANCVPLIAAAPAASLDPWSPSESLPHQAALVRFAETARHFIVLLDAPYSASTRQALAWRRRFDSDFAAAYHPWTAVGQTRPNGQFARALVPPAACAAGIIAARELRLGLPWGPAREQVVGGVSVERHVSPPEHDELHLEGVNVVLQDADGITITAARTMSSDRSYRQISVRRLMTMLQLSLEQQAQWVVFEPNNPSLRRWLQHLLTAYLTDLFEAGAFAGSSPDEAFFVNVGDDLNDQRASDLGQLLVEVGVAPVEPIEYLVLRIAADSDGLIQVVERRD